MAYSIFGHFQTFTPGGDSQLYGYSSINLAKGEFSLENEFLEQTGSVNFIPNQFRITQFNTLVPSGNFGIYAIGALSFLMGGYIGLFYLGPIFAILLLILSERISTNLFGKFAGLITLILVSTDFMIYNRAQVLGTDIIFSFFLLLGCFYLIKFLTSTPNYKNIILCSTFLSLTAFFRMNGIIFFPVELLIVSVLIIFLLYKNNNKKNFLSFFTIKKWIRKNGKFVILFFIPWLMFFSFFASYNSYYFGDPTTTYREVRCQTVATCPDKGNIIFSFLDFDLERIEWIKFYSVPLLPDEIKTLLERYSPSNTSKILGDNWLSVLSLIIIAGILIYSIKNKNKQTEILIIISFIVATLSFFSMSYIAPSSFNINPDIQDRYMLSNTTLGFLLIGFFLSSVFENKKTSSFQSSKFAKKYLRIIVVIFIIIFLIFSIIESKPIDKGLHFRDPIKVAKNFPKDLEGLSEKSIIIDHRGRKALEYNAIAFNWALGERSSTAQNLKSLLESNNEVFTFKKYYASSNTSTFFKNLESNHGIIMKDYSKTFCKMILLDSSIKMENQTLGDKICYK